MSKQSKKKFELPDKKEQLVTLVICVRCKASFIFMVYKEDAMRWSDEQDAKIIFPYLVDDAQSLMQTKLCVKCYHASMDEIEGIANETN